MRLWHKELLPVLPRQQLLGQWRECCAIAQSIAENGKTNHILINRIMDYPIEHFIKYSQLVFYEMKRRKFSVMWESFSKYIPSVQDDAKWYVPYDDLFKNWHNRRYLIICYYNLMEKYESGGFSDKEWEAIRLYLGTAHNVYSSFDEIERKRSKGEPIWNIK